MGGIGFITDEVERLVGTIKERGTLVSRVAELERRAIDDILAEGLDEDGNPIVVESPIAEKFRDLRKTGRGKDALKQLDDTDTDGEEESGGATPTSSKPGTPVVVTEVNEKLEPVADGDDANLYFCHPDCRV